MTENVSTQLNRGFEQLRCAAAQRMSNRPWTHPRTCQTQTWGSGCSAVKLVTLDLDRYLREKLKFVRSRGDTGKRKKEVVSAKMWRGDNRGATCNINSSRSCVSNATHVHSVGPKRDSQPSDRAEQAGLGPGLWSDRRAEVSETR